jgi:copper chaperone
MEIIKFKTTIKCSGCVAKATPFLNDALGQGNWKVDTDDPSKQLTAIGQVDAKKVIEAVEKAGFRAEML